MNIREAILKAADSIEQNPTLFNFRTTKVPDFDCGTPGCAIGWIAFHLDIGEERHDHIEGSGRYWTGIDKAFIGCKDSAQFYDRMNDFGLDWTKKADDCAKTLRFYADTYQPVEQAEKAPATGIPDWCRQIFVVEEAA